MGQTSWAHNNNPTVDESPRDPVPLEAVKRRGESHRRCGAHVPGAQRCVDVREEEMKQTAVEVGPVFPEGRRRRGPKQRRVVGHVAETVYERGEGPKRGPWAGRSFVSSSCARLLLHSPARPMHGSERGTTFKKKKKKEMLADGRYTHTGVTKEKRNDEAAITDLIRA